MARVPRGAMSIVQTWSAGGVMKVTVTSVGPVGSTLSITGAQVELPHVRITKVSSSPVQPALGPYSSGASPTVDAVELGGGR